MGKKTMKIIALEIDEFDLTSGVDRISLVETPAIEENFYYFNEQKFESYTDYPKQATENAKIALRWADENGWGDCGTPVGKARANQLAKGEPITEETIARMAAFERHRQNSQKELGDGCGRLMWLAWGGDAGVEWAQRKLEQIRNEEFEEGIPHYTADGKLYEGPTHKDASGRLMTGATHTEDSEYLYHLEDLSVKYTDEQIFEKVLEDIISEEYVDDLPEEIQENILKQLESVGETEEELRAAGWIKDELGDERFIIQSTADLSSLEDSGDRIYRYQYRVKPGKGAPIQNDTRTFCRTLISMDKLYRKEDINKMTYTGENSAFAQKGSLIYDIFKYAGGKYCRHQWVKVPFKKANIKNSFAEQDREKQMVVGPIMVPKKLIYRFDEWNGEYWVYFTEDTIEKIAHKYLINNYQSSVNIDHEEDNVVEDVTLVESWLVENPEKDKSYAMMGKKYPKGTWFGTMKINNKKVWNEYIKEGKVLGWSVEGYFADKMINQSKQTFYYRTTEGGTEIVIDENTSVVFILKGGERTVTLPDGEYKLTNGETLVVEDSKAKGNF